MKRVAILLLAPLLMGQAPIGAVDIVVDGVRNGNGHVLAEICPKERFLQPACPWRGSAMARSGQVTVRISGVPSGVFAAQVYHDENDNHKVDRNFLGIPTEGLGFSNDAPFRFGPPTFDDAAFRVGPDGARIVLKLRYLN